MDFESLDEVQDMPQEKKNTLDVIVALKALDAERDKLQKQSKHWDRVFWAGIAAIAFANADKIFAVIEGLKNL